MTISAKFRQGARGHSEVEAYVRSHLVGVAESVCSAYPADQDRLAQDAINARVGVSTDCRRGFFRDLTATAQLRSTPEGVREAAWLRESEARLRRLTYLRDALYKDPVLLLVDYLERNPDSLKDPKELVEWYSGVAAGVRAFEAWWAPLLMAWGKLAAQVENQASLDASFQVLLEAIRRLDGRIADKYGMPKKM